MLFDRPKILCEEIRRDRRFFIEKYNKTLYLYVTDMKYSKMFCVLWIANLTAAPEEIDVKSMNKGKPPRMPREHCRSDIAKEGLKSVPEFRFEWREDQDGKDVALSVFGGDELFSAVSDCFGDVPKGYNRFTVGTTSYGDAFPQNN